MANETIRKTIKLRPDPVPPDHLSDAAKATFTQIVRDYAMVDDVVGLSILVGALEAWDKAQDARRAIAKEGLQVKDRYGKWKPHPMLKIEAQFLAEYRAAIKALHFDLEPLRPGPGAPPKTERR